MQGTLVYVKFLKIYGFFEKVNILCGGTQSDFRFFFQQIIKLYGEKIIIQLLIIILHLL